MATVTMTGNVKDILRKPDTAPVYFWTPFRRDGVLSVRPQYVVPDQTTGDFSVELEAGAAVASFGGKDYEFTAADGVDVWTAIKVGLAIPPQTSAQRLQEAVDAWATGVGDSRYVTPSAMSTAVNALKALIVGPNAPATLDTIAEIATALGNDPQLVSNLVTAVAGKYSKPSGGIPLSDLKKTDLDASYAAISAALLNAAAAPDLMAVGTITRSATKAATGFAVVWAVDGATGVFTGTESTSTPGAIDSYSVTHVLSGVTTTYIQPALTRDASGAVTARPAMTVS